ncbi:MAG TPA: alpha/beta hydrolase [Hyphomonadaceae bacterium]|jgi:pimeloyl-ACP methyl ester carboxylesterase|nr:alpha/beta hydrolase [Hyphomonadaceae bacterium]
MRVVAGIVLGLALLCACVSKPAPAAPQRIAEARYLTIGGIEQWVTMRGNDDRKPVLLLLHGGPGDVQSAFASAYVPYERDFVLVQWDQRGAGRTFAKNGAAGVSLEKLVADGIDLSQQLRARFPGHRLILMGHSWGTIIGSGMAQQRPELFDAYVGTGQVAAWADTVQWQFDFLKQRYRETGNAAELAKLEAIGKPDPKNIAQYFGWSRALRQNGGPADAGWFKDMMATAKANGETDETIKAASAGQSASGAALIGVTVLTDLPVTAPAFRMPYYVIQGRDDLNAPTALARAYFDKVQTPRKQYAVIEDAGHFALATHAAEFDRLLTAMVR